MNTTKNLGLSALVLATTLLVGCANNTTTNTNATTVTPVTNTTVTTNTNTVTVTNTNSTAANTNTTVANDNALTFTNVAKHGERSSCWLIIENNVYDVTDFVPQHPGGSDILEGCGKDATGLFNGTDPIGRMHSSLAKSMLNKYKLGALEK